MLNFRPGLIGGAEMYLRNLASHAAAAAGNDTIILLLTRDNADRLEHRGEQRVVVERSDSQIVLARSMEAFTPLRAKFAERALAEARPDVVLFPQQSLFPKRVSCPCVLIVHDLLHLYLPQYVPLAERAFRRCIYPYSLRRADHVIATSAFTRKTLIERYHLRPEDITVVMQGMPKIDTGSIQPSNKVKSPYLYYPAATFGHKGHDVLLRSFAALRRRGGFDHKLVLTGLKTPLWTDLKALIRRLGIEAEVVHLGFVPRQEVLELYKGATAVVFPSRFEGFGRPVWEAAQFDKKVIVSRLEVFAEIGVPEEFQIDFADTDQFAAALAAEGPTKLEKEPWTASQTADVILDVLRATASADRTRPAAH